MIDSIAACPGSTSSNGPRRLRRAAIALALTAASILALAATPASAAFRHVEITNQFGPDGTTGTTFTGMNTIAYNQANHRLYVQGSENIYGMNIAGPGSYAPLGGAFPLSINAGAIDSDIAVDNTAGPSANNIYLANDGSQIQGFDASGSPLAGWPVSIGSETCGVAVDKDGNVWGGNWPNQRLVEFAPSGGGSIGNISTAAVGNPCKLTFDTSNNDVYPSMYSGPIYQALASSGYSEFKLFDGGGYEDRLTVNAAKGRLYVMHTNSIVAYDTATGDLLENITLPTSMTGVAVNESNDTLYAAGGSGQVVEIPNSVVPKAITGPPVGNSSVSGTSEADGGGPVIECVFQFGPDANYGSQQACSALEGNVTANLPGLEGEKTYHYRIFVKNGSPGGSNFGVDRTITPHNVKALKTEAPSPIGRTTATFHASYEGTNEDTNYYFEWGPAAGEYTSGQSAVPPGPNNGKTVGPTALSYAASGLTAGTTYHFRVVAQNSLGISKGDDEVFTTLPPASNVTTEAPTGVTPTGAELHGSFDIDAVGGETFAYFQLGTTTSYGGVTATPPGPSSGSTPGHPSVSATVALSPGTTYHYRIAVTNSLGTAYGNDVEFTTPQPPTIEAVTSSNLTASTADLIASINPQGAATTYRFEYGTTSAYGSTVPSGGEGIGSGLVPVPVNQHIENLEVGVVYHFRVVAENPFGSAESEDQTFSFFTPNCPNAHLRQQSGAAYLPDCRAYELVSPQVAGAVQLFPGGGIGGGTVGENFWAFPQTPNPGFASGHFGFWGGIGQITGTDPPNVLQDLYFSTRTATGWETHYPGVPGTQTLIAGGQECDLTMTRCIGYDLKDPLELNSFDTGSNAPYVYNANEDSNAIGRFPTNVESVPGGEDFKGAHKVSADFSHFAFSSTNVKFDEEGVLGAPGSAYDNDTASGAVELISLMPNNDPIEQDAGGPEEFIKIPAISRNGSHILMSTEAAKGIHLYMRVADSVTYDVSEGNGVTFAGMTPDGTRVFFSSEEKLTADDHDTSVDLYMWEEASEEVTRISSGTGGTGDTDSCTASWIQKCGVEPASYQVEGQSEEQEIGNKIFTGDTWIADNGDFYFYSPELLDGTSHGEGNQRNLYVFREGRPQAVAAFKPTAPAVRIQVNPADTRVAFVTSTQLTSFESKGRREMYTFDPATQKLNCVSCIPTGAAPNSDVEAANNGIFMSDDGRTFFSTADALVPFDSNGLRDVYEYVDGRPQLISSGTANQDTWGGGLLIYPAMVTGLEGVSRDGTDVYFSTFDTLVSQDHNGEFIKFYDARTGGGFPAEAPPPGCNAADECHGPGSVTPPAPQFGTGAKLGKTGNHPKNKKKKKKHKKKKHQKRHHARQGGQR